MKVDAELVAGLSEAGSAAKKSEAQGYDGLWSSEISHDPFFGLLLAAADTERLELVSAIAVAFARNPMTMAMAAWDLNAFSQGRLTLGLGSQVKPHIERRFSMPWSQPAARMREFISAMKAIWDCWQNDVPLDFQGEFYTHTLMTPFFNPGPNAFGAPKVILAAVGEGMTRVASEVADGMLVHGFATEKSLRAVTLPIIEAGLAETGRTRQQFTIAYPAFVTTGDDAEEMAVAKLGTCKQIAFYASTPAYRSVLETHGWGDLQPELLALSKAGEWDTMGTLITDEMLDAFSVVGPPEDVAGLLEARFGDLVDRVRLYLPYETPNDPRPRILSALRDGSLEGSSGQAAHV